jgi:hypothetical protein
VPLHDLSRAYRSTRGRSRCCRTGGKPCHAHRTRCSRDMPAACVESFCHTCHTCHVSHTRARIRIYATAKIGTLAAKMTGNRARRFAGRSWPCWRQMLFPPVVTRKSGEGRTSRPTLPGPRGRALPARPGRLPAPRARWPVPSRGHTAPGEERDRPGRPPRPARLRWGCAPPSKTMTPFNTMPSSVIFHLSTI